MFHLDTNKSAFRYSGYYMIMPSYLHLSLVCAELYFVVTLKECFAQIGLFALVPVFTFVVNVAYYVLTKYNFIYALKQRLKNIHKFWPMRLLCAISFILCIYISFFYHKRDAYDFSTLKEDTMTAVLYDGVQYVWPMMNVSVKNVVQESCNLLSLVNDVDADVTSIITTYDVEEAVPDYVIAEIEARYRGIIEEKNGVLKQIQSDVTLTLIVLSLNALLHRITNFLLLKEYKTLVGVKISQFSNSEAV